MEDNKNKRNRVFRGWRRYFLVIPFALGVSLSSKLVSLILGVNLTLEHNFLLLWFVSTVVLRVSSRFNFISGLIVLSLSPSFLIFRNEPWADRAAAFAFLLLAIGTLQRVWHQFSVPGRSSGGAGGEGV